jgi:hypothetical protein
MGPTTFLWLLLLMMLVSEWETLLEEIPELR